MQFIPPPSSQPNLVSRNRRPRAAFRPRLERLEDRLTPAAFWWDNEGGDGLWQNPLNWDSMELHDTLPGSGDHAVIGMGFSVVSSQPTAVGSVAINSPITFLDDLTLGAALMSYMSQSATFYGQVNLGATLSLGGLMGGGGTFHDDVTIAADAELMLSGGAYAFHDGVAVNGAGTVRNSTGSTLTSNGDVAINVEFTSFGDVQVLTGALSLTSGGQLAGTAMANAAANLLLAAGPFDLQPGFVFTGSGFLVTTGSDTIVFGDVVATNYRLSSGNLDGTGTLRITERFTWFAEGAVKGGGRTRIDSGATLSMEIANAPVFSQTARVLENHGTVQWMGTSEWDLSSSARIQNYGLIRAFGGADDIHRLHGQLVPLPPESLINYNTVTFEGGLNRVDSIGVENYGTIRQESVADSGKLTFATPTFLSRGVIEAQTSNQDQSTSGMAFSTGVYEFLPYENGPAMMTGSGWFVASGEIVASSGDIMGTPVIADNFLLLNGTIRGAGTFQAHNLQWFGGTMRENGITLVDAGDQLTIDSTCTVETRELLIKGNAQWDTGHIFLNAGAKIVIDGGSFSIAQDEGFVTSSTLAQPGWISLKNAGTLEKPYHEMTGQTVLEVLVDNDGSTVRFNGGARIEGSYRQTATSSLLELGYAQYTITRPESGDSFIVNGGIVRLLGGELQLNTFHQITHLNNATFEGCGTLRGSLVVSQSQFHLTGDLWYGGMGGELYFTGGNTRGYLHGYRLRNSAAVHIASNATVYRQGGSMNIAPILEGGFYEEWP